MTSSTNNLLSQTIKTTINNLYFYDFPCGKGSWNFSDNYRENASLIREEDLIELLNTSSSPWNRENNCSNEIFDIQKNIIAKKLSPSLKTLKKMFNTLRLVDKNIAVVDEDIGGFENLNELILSTNYIESINSKNLPKNLKILELYSNRLQSLEFLLSKYMPSLHHLGIGANLISDVDILSRSHLKLSLVSLDLSKNQLTNMSKTIQTIKQLPNIKNLILAGNPLSLFAIYRAYVIDSIKSLIALDDYTITADERFSVKKMEETPDFMKELCKFKIQIESINNIPVKEKPENAPEEPIIKIDYFVKFWFPFQFIQKQGNLKIEDLSEKILDTDKITNDDIMYMHASEKFPRINSEIMVNLSEDIPIGNVARFCDFLNENLRIEIIEETKYLYSPENLPSKTPSRMGSQNSKRRQQKSASKQGSNNNATKPKEPAKKKKIDESKLVVHLKTDEKIAEYSVNLSSFQNGEVSYDQILKSDIIEKKANKTEEISKKSLEKESKGKKSSAKGDHKKAIDKNNIRKEEISPTTTTEQIKAIECHLNMKLLTISTIKSMEVIT